MHPITVAPIAAGALVLLGKMANKSAEDRDFDNPPHEGPLLVQEGLGTYTDTVGSGATHYQIQWKITREANGRFTWAISFLNVSRPGYASSKDFGTAELARDAMLATHPEIYLG